MQESLDIRTLITSIAKETNKLKATVIQLGRKLPFYPRTLVTKKTSLDELFPHLPEKDSNQIAHSCLPSCLDSYSSSLMTTSARRYN